MNRNYLITTLLIVVLFSFFQQTAIAEFVDANHPEVQLQTPDGSISFGSSVCISGDTAVVGASKDTIEGCASGSGAVYVYRYDGFGGWNLEATLVASDANLTISEDSRFGYAVSLHDNFLIVGAPSWPIDHGEIPDRSGAVYIFERNPSGGWDEIKQLTCPNPYGWDRFGHSVAISDHWAVVGAPAKKASASHVNYWYGASYLFYYDNSDWVIEASWGPDTYSTSYSHAFGSAVDIYGNSIIVGAPQEPDLWEDDQYIYRDAGAVYIYEYEESIWIPKEHWTGAYSKDRWAFGASVAIDAEHALIGIPEMHTPQNGDDDARSGQALAIMRDNDGQWNRSSDWRLYPEDIKSKDYYGSSVSVDGSYAAVGRWPNAYLPFDDGYVDIWVRADPSGRIWDHSTRLKPSVPVAEEGFGRYVSLSGSNVIVTTARNVVYIFTIDSDNDGITDPIEDEFCTDKFDVDSDDDGIADGDEDANQNGIVDTDETDPCNFDTDGDGIQDGTELGYVDSIADPDGDGPLKGTDEYIFMPDQDPTTITDPLNADTDGDGISDGDEDTNKDGKIDTGETDPNTCDGSLWLHDDTVESGEVREEVTLCSIEAGSNYLIQPNATVTFQAGVKITLSTGFTASAGSNFQAFLQPK